jgi:hypothetical protein
MAETQDNNSKLDGTVPQDQVNKNNLILKIF